VLNLYRREVKLWLDAAEDDIIDAEDGLRRERWFRSAFYAQQAVEKALKALFFVVRKEDPPKIHTITELYLLLNEGGFKLPKELEDQIYIFNKYYTITRYPDAANGLPRDSVDRIEAERAVRLAKEVLKYVRSWIRENT